MDDNMSEDDSREENHSDSINNSSSNKRFKGDTSSSEKSEESSSSSSNVGERESASTSSDSGFPKSRGSRNRNYRNNHIGDSNANDSNENSTEQENAAESDVNITTSTPRSTTLSHELEESSISTIFHDSDDTDSEEERPVLLKEKPKHNWFMISSLINRQIGSSSKMKCDSLFRNKCYGSLRNVKRLELMYKLDEHRGCVNSLNFHPDGSLLASGSDDLKICVWDWKVGKCMLKYESKHKQNVFQSKFLHLSGDLHIASCARDGQVRIAQISREEGMRHSRKLGAHKGACNKLAIHPDQPLLILSAGEDGCVLSHDLRQNKPDRLVLVKNTVDERDVALYSVHSNPLNSQEFCVSGREEIVRTYDQRKTNTPLNTYHPFQTEKKNRRSYHVTCAVYNYNGSEILASYSDEDIYLFDVNGPPGNYKQRYQGHRNGATIKGVNFFGPRSEFIVSGSDCGHLFFWEKQTEAIVRWMLADDNGVVNCLEPHPSLPFIATSGLDSDIKFWVPSCEQDQSDEGLKELIKRNRRGTEITFETDLNESQMLWMLWRHLRNSSRRVGGNSTEIISPSSSSSSSDTELSQEEDDDDEIEGPSGCTAS